MGLRLDEAGSIAGADGNSPTDLARLRFLSRAKIEQIDADVEALLYMLTVIHEIAPSASTRSAA